MKQTEAAGLGTSFVEDSAEGRLTPRAARKRARGVRTPIWYAFFLSRQSTAPLLPSPPLGPRKSAIKQRYMLASHQDKHLIRYCLPLLRLRDTITIVGSRLLDPRRGVSGGTTITCGLLLQSS